MSRTVVMLVTNDAVSDPRVEKEAHALTSAGWSVTILAWDRTGANPVSEDRGGVRIERLGPRAGYGAGMRSLRAFDAFWHLAIERTREIDPGVVHCHDLDTAPAGLGAIRGRKTKLVLDFHELYRETRMIPRGAVSGPIARAVVDFLEKSAVAEADLVFVVSPAMLDRYTPAMGERAMVLENAPDASMFRPSASPVEDRPFTVCYIGQKRYIAPLRSLVDIVSRNASLAAILAGGGTEADALAAHAAGVPRVEVVGRVVYDDIPSYYERSDAVYAVYDASVGNIRVAIPVKGLEGMACGLPLLCNAGTWFGDYVVEHGIGIAVDGADPASIEDGLVRLAGDRGAASEMGARGRRLIEEGLSWDAVASRLVAAYGSLDV